VLIGVEDIGAVFVEEIGDGGNKSSTVGGVEQQDGSLVHGISLHFR
jgi:hypothetical protein